MIADVWAQLKELDDAPPQPLMKARGGRRQVVQAVEAITPPPFYPVATIRQALTDRVDEYLAQPIATERLLLNVDPGVGKTWLGVATAHKEQMKGRKVAYIMPRHDFFDNLMTVSQYGPEYFFQWLPRTAQTERFHETCHLTDQIGTWIKRGHESTKFCSQVCGHDHMRHSCIYWNQIEEYKRRTQALGVPPILCLQHQHLTLGHTLLPEMDLVIGDESPLLSAFGYEIHVPTKMLTYRQPSVPAKLLAHKLAKLAPLLAEQISGQTLIDMLGGADEIIKLVNLSTFEDRKQGIESADQVDNVPFEYLLDFCILIKREAELSKRGDYPNRVLLSSSGLTLLMRRSCNPELPPRTIWLDGTANVALYRELTGWKLSTLTMNAELLAPVNQITDSVFNKTTMMVDKSSTTPKARQVVNYVKHLITKHGYVNPLIVSYQNDELARLFQPYHYTHFGGNRGSNVYQTCDAVIVLGTPQPSAMAIEYEARKLYHRRDTPFNATWCETLRSYAGTDKAMTTSGLWNDPDLQTILDQIRDAELVQSAHRVRPILSPKPIWLLTSLPVPSLPPTLMTMLEAIGLCDVDGLSVFTFLDALDIAKAKLDECGYCTTADLALLLDISPKWANKYLDALIAYDATLFPEMTIRAVGRGRPKRAIGTSP